MPGKRRPAMMSGDRRVVAGTLDGRQQRLRCPRAAATSTSAATRGQIDGDPPHARHLAQGLVHGRDAAVAAHAFDPKPHCLGRHGARALSSALSRRGDRLHRSAVKALPAMLADADCGAGSLWRARMHRRFGLVGLVVLLPSLSAAAIEWRVDPARSTLSVVFDQGGKPVTAKFESFQAKVSFDPAKSCRLQCGDHRRSRELSQRRCAARPDGDRRRVPECCQRGHGDLSRDHLQGPGRRSLRGRGRAHAEGIAGRLTHPATITVSGEKARAQGEVVLNRVDFGVGAAQFPRGDQVGLTVTVRFDLAATRAG